MWHYCVMVARGTAENDAEEATDWMKPMMWQRKPDTQCSSRPNIAAAEATGVSSHELIGLHPSVDEWMSAFPELQVHFPSKGLTRPSRREVISHCPSPRRRLGARFGAGGRVTECTGCGRPPHRSLPGPLEVRETLGYRPLEHL